MSVFRSRELCVNGTRVVIRCAEEKDAAEVLEHKLRSTVEGEHYLIERDEIEQTAEAQAAWIRRQREGACAVAMVAIVEEDDVDRVVGMINFATMDKRRANHRGMFGISVRASHQGMGIGRAMIEHLLDWAREHPIVEIVALGCYAGNTRAQKLYREMGFIEESRAVDMFKTGPGQYHDDIIMTMRVKPQF